ncbi:MAG TPA: hypothetical protein VKY29_02670, partial [Cryomorphaceae bacterium]|nr:hypothetical protein [Cryomorphaceae bacterium]
MDAHDSNSGHSHHDHSHEHHHGDHNDDQHDHHGHDHAHHVADYKMRFVISLVVTIPVLALSPMIQKWLGFELTFPGDSYVLALLSTFIFFYGGYPFLKGLYDEVKANAIGMMTLIGVAITVAWAYSTAVTFGLEGVDFYWEMATLIVVMLIGHYFEMKSVMGASRSLELLVEMMPAEAHRIEGEKVLDVSVDELQIGD